MKVGVLQGRLSPTRERGIQFFPYGEWEAEFDAANRIGLDCIELLVQRKDWGNPEHPLLSSEGVSKIREVSARSGVATPSVHAYFEPRESYPEELATIARAAEAVGASVVLLSFFKHAALTSDEAKQSAKRYIDAALQKVGAASIRFGLEAELPAKELLDFIATLERPERFGVYYDLGNQYACGFPVTEELRTLGERVVGVHIKDRVRQEAGAPESPSVPLGTGSANMPEALATLRDIGYERPLIIQGARQEGKDDEEVVQEYYEFVRQLAA